MLLHSIFSTIRLQDNSHYSRQLFFNICRGRVAAWCQVRLTRLCRNFTENLAALAVRRATVCPISHFRYFYTMVKEFQGPVCFIGYMCYSVLCWHTKRSSLLICTSFLDFNIRNVKVECRFLRFQKLKNNLKSHISDTATNIRLNLQHCYASTGITESTFAAKSRHVTSNLPRHSRTLVTLT